MSCERQKRCRAERGADNRLFPGDSFHLCQNCLSLSRLLKSRLAAKVKALLFQGFDSATEAGVAELVDALDLGSSASRRGGSSPSTRTRKGQAGGGARSLSRCSHSAVLGRTGKALHPHKEIISSSSFLQLLLAVYGKMNRRGY